MSKSEETFWLRLPVTRVEFKYSENQFALVSLLAQLNPGEVLGLEDAVRVLTDFKERPTVKEVMDLFTGKQIVVSRTDGGLPPGMKNARMRLKWLFS